MRTADHPAVLKDYAYLSQGLLDLFETTGEVRWLKEALALADAAMKLCKDPAGGFFDAPSTSRDVIVRTKEFYDGAIPSGNGYLSRLLLRLAALSGEKRFEEGATDILKTFKERITQRPASSCTMAEAAVMLHDGLREIVLLGPREDPRTRSLLRAISEVWTPDAVLCALDPETAARAAGIIPLLEGRLEKKGAPLVYICRNGVCKLPLSDPKQVHKALEKQP